MEFGAGFLTTMSCLRCNPISTNLSHPLGDKVNDFIDSEKSWINYAPFDALDIISVKGNVALLEKKMGISNAFKWLLICSQGYCF